MKYTSQGEKHDEFVQKYIDIVVATLLKEIPDLKSIVLSGGFGRGEGSLEEKDGQLVPVNDFEIYLVAEYKISEEKLNRAANEASKNLKFKNWGVPFYTFSREDYADTFYIDMKAFQPEELKKVLPMIKYYELRNASTVVWGEDYLKNIPDFKVEDLPLAEGFRILLNRISMLCCYFSADFIKNKMSREEKHGFLYIAGKTLVDIPTALLLLNNKFKPTYHERTNIFSKCYKTDFKELHKTIPGLPKVVEEGLNFKSNPDFSVKIDQFETFNKFRNNAGEAAKYFISKMVNKKIKSYSQLAEVIYYDLWALYYGPYVKHKFKLKAAGGLGVLTTYLVMRFLNLLYFYRLITLRKIFYPKCISNNRAPDITLFTSVIYLIYCIKDNGEINLDMLSKARYYLQKVYPVFDKSEEPKKEWDIISEALSNAYVLYFFLKIV